MRDPFCGSARAGWRAVFGAVLFGLMLSPVTAATPGLPLGWQDEWPRTDFSRHTVALGEIMSGGPPKDGIPAIDRPQFIGTREAARWLNPREPVIVYQHNGDARAYPLQILMFHEIVNDTVGGLPVAVTFCPLCNASIVFDRKVGDVVLDFGTTGKLRMSDLVMYDRQTESWWQQFTGTGIVGRHAGAVLRQLPSVIAPFEEFVGAYPQGRVLSRNTGYRRDYGKNPYRGYDEVGGTPFLFNDPVDPRLPPMERVLGVMRNGVTRVYPLTTLLKQPIINDVVAGEAVVVFSRLGMLSALSAERISESRQIPAAAAFGRRVQGRVLEFEQREGRIVDRETGSTWNLFGHATAGKLRGTKLVAVDSGVHFAFAWLAFQPASEIYGAAGAGTSAAGAAKAAEKRR